MQRQRVSPRQFRPTLSLALFAIFLLLLWIAGGASRADVLGQVVVRAGCWGLLVLAALFAPQPRLEGARPIAILLAAAAILVAVQLIPLPPGIWQALPGRGLLAEAAAASGAPQPWRPWAMVPGATANALSSLVVPLAALVLVGALADNERKMLPAMMLGLAFAAALMGLFQFSGAVLNNPFINDTPGETSGVFANRNHFALFMAIGCVLAPVWAFHAESRLQWRGPAAAGLTLVFLLAILASGSRVGVALGAVGAALGVAIVAERARRLLHRAPRWMFTALISSAVGLVAALGLAVVLADRAVSIDRMLATELNQDMRSRGLPTVLIMIGEYFPAGAGAGGFDPLFRMHEPFALLKPTYFNHAHNDWLEIVLDTGLVGGLLLAAAVLWWAVASLRAWRSDASLAKLGSAVILLVLAASAFDYPARTPMIMTVLVLAGLWLSQGGGRIASALPGEHQHL
jgi:O-antigen ligase